MSSLLIDLAVVGSGQHLFARWYGAPGLAALQSGGAPVGQFVGAGKPALYSMGISAMNFPKGRWMPGGFLHSGTTDLLVQVDLCGAGCPGLCRMSSSFPGLHPLVWQTKYLQMLSDIPWGPKLPLVENHCHRRTTGTYFPMLWDS